MAEVKDQSGSSNQEEGVVDAASPVLPPPPVKTPIENLRPLAAIATISGEKIVADGTIILDPDQTVFSLRWGGVLMRFNITPVDLETKSSVNVTPGEIDLGLFVTKGLDLYVKFKNVALYGGNNTHISVFLKSQINVERPARIVSYNISSTDGKLP